MQGMDRIISTEVKINYINSLLKVGFHTLDCGSFVSAKAIPQMADTREVLSKVNRAGNTKTLVIVANERGAEEACSLDVVDCLGYPFSISETFQQRNTNAGIEESKVRLTKIQQFCAAAKKELVVYISMAFGNPYGDPYSAEIVYQYSDWLASCGVKIISLADTVGLADASLVHSITSTLVKNLQDVVVGVHLHTTAANWKEKLQAALDAGCGRVDGALLGFGGCPMAGNDLVGNMDMLNIVAHLNEQHICNTIHLPALSSATALAQNIFH